MTDRPGQNLKILTPREKEILYLVLRGYTSRQIARRLHLSIYTVKTHRKAIHRKLRVNNLARLIQVVVGVEIPTE